MKRDRRGRFLPAEVEAAPEIEAPPPDAAAAAAAKRETRPGRPAAAGAPPREPERSAPEGEEVEAEEPERWASAEAAGISRGFSTGYCRLCHGKFSSRSLRNAFGKVPMMGENTEKQRRLGRVFFADFQRLVGVTARQDPSLPQFVCKKCHAQFYKCRSILTAFIQKVNFSPTSHLKPRGKNNVVQPPPPAPEENASSFAELITSSPQCLHQLVMWAHSHAETCQVAPSLQSVLSSGYRGIIRAVWGCREGHNYVMSTDADCSALLVNSAFSAKWELNKSASEHVAGNGVGAGAAGTLPEPQPHLATSQPPTDGVANALPVLSPGDEVPKSHDLPSLEDVPRASVQTEVPACSLNGSPEPLSEKPVPPEASDERVKDEFSDLSEGDSLSDREEENHNKNNQRAAASDEVFSLYPEKSNRKAESQGGNSEEAKVKKKPGPKPGWKKKIKSEREELPTIFKCPYQGCTAVYRGADGMKKHIKEHHEEVRERPCPHPGCNKVFMIDRYLQRHVKLIHTEVRNYICDECGHTFKQRKHLSVHQMRHSGAKPLQCEICGFQCRQRASLKYHMTKHKAETELEFACDQCGKRFEKAHNLNVHMSMVHPLTQAQEKPKATVEGERRPVPEAAVIIATAAVVALGTAENQPVKVELCTQQHEPT